ncbi:flagellar hook-basal body complex protein FliE [Salinicola peritrichatus]|uniref:flagellar hook-basal body complex protein FliE n=1 Tax=Salinicola peritrichatus TaxID=1267424 RepID=UPI000DA20ECA|nr:flagellar hook-basal body complex protein FliE [Salinicola peritrichatus]
MSAPAIQAALQQMQALSAQASGQNAGSSSPSDQAPGSFAGELQASLGRINQMQQSANQQAMSFQAGDPDVALNDVMIDMQKASVAFEMGVQVRNRLVTAYKDVMGMQI